MKETHGSSDGFKVSNKKIPSEKKLEGALEQKEAMENAQLIKKARDIVNGLPDVRRLRIEAIKRQIREGTYRVDCEALAEKIILEILGPDKKK